MAYSTDTRTLQAGDIFVAIPGERFDGHDFVAAALKKGAAGAIVERQVAGVDAGKLQVVQDTTLYLAKMARARVRHCTVVAVTGSVGKTTTKNAIAAILGAGFPVTASQGNLNTLLGLSMTLVNRDIGPDTKLVLEMGASAKGDIAGMCEYFSPDISVVTNIRGVHLDTFGSLEGVQRAKGELVRALTSDGLACLNADDPMSGRLSKWCAGRTVTYGKGSGCDIAPADITVRLPLLGEHVIYVAMAAFAVGRACGISPAAINRALKTLKPEKGRLCRLPGRSGSVLVDDSYNASPDAMESALRVLFGLPARRRIVFMGDMLELGPTAVQQHRRLIKLAISRSDRVFVVGSIGRAAVADLPRSYVQRVKMFDDSAEVVQLLDRIYVPQVGDLVLVKGSQGSRMERISRVLLDENIDPAAVLPRHTPAWLSI